MKLRAKLGFSFAETARLLGISASAVTRIKMRKNANPTEICLSIFGSP